MKSKRSKGQLLVVGAAALLGCLFGFFVAAGSLMTLGVRCYGHEDYFSPFYHEAGTPVAKLAGGAAFVGAGILGSVVPLIIAWRRTRRDQAGEADPTR